MRRALTFLNALCRHQSGASAVEFALVLPILVALTIGTIDLGRMAWTKMQVQAAARAGATYALVNATKAFDAAKVASAVTSATTLTVTLPAQPSKSYGCPTGADGASGVTAVANNTTPCPLNNTTPGTYVTVQAATTYTPIWMSAVTLSSTAKVRIS